MSQPKNPNELYEKASKGDISIDFWGTVPSSFQEAVDLAVENYKPGILRSGSGDGTLEELKNILTKYHKDLGIFSPKVADNIAKLDKGSVLVGQQPVIMGGPGFIGNKIACLMLLSQLFEDRDHTLCPVFFVGDYVVLQK